MTKKSLAAITARKSGLTQHESKVLMDATFNVLVGYLSVEKKVTIPHFGTFDVHLRKKHRFFNLIRSVVMMAPKKYSVLFHPSQEYKEKMLKKIHHA